MKNETTPNRAITRAVMLGLTALCLVTLGAAAIPTASAWPVLPPFEKECVALSGSADYWVCTGPGDPAA